MQEWLLGGHPARKPIYKNSTGYRVFSVCKGSTGYRVFWYGWKEKILEKMRKRPQGGKERKKTCAKKKARGMMERLEKSTVMAQLIKALDLQTQELVKCHKLTGEAKYH